MRLTGSQDPAARAAWARRQEVAAENRAAAANPSLDPGEGRRVIAQQTHEQLQGAILSYESRRRVLETARELGIRAFDSTLIMALVQDDARRGDSHRARRVPVALKLAAALLCAAALALLLIWWVTQPA